MATVEWARLRADELRALASQEAIVVVPVAAIEQHGPHLPVETDTVLTAEVTRRAAEKAAPACKVVVTPVVWSGISEHHMALGGTLSLDFDSFRAVVAGVCRAVHRHGFRRILIVNGHGGNDNAIRVIADQLGPELGIPVAACTYWKLAIEHYPAILDEQPGVQHACEAETSMMLALVGDRVAMDRIKEPSGRKGSDSAELVGPLVHMWRSFKGRSHDGVIGAAAAATAEKGERLLEASAEALAKVLTNEGFWSLSVR